MGRTKQTLRNDRRLYRHAASTIKKDDKRPTLGELYLTDMPNVDVEKWYEIVARGEWLDYEWIEKEGRFHKTIIMITKEPNTDGVEECVAYVNVRMPTKEEDGFEEEDDDDERVFCYRPSQMSPSAFTTWLQYQFVPKEKRGTYRGTANWRVLFSEKQYELLTGKSILRHEAEDNELEAASEMEIRHVNPLKRRAKDSMGDESNGGNAHLCEDSQPPKKGSCEASSVFVSVSGAPHQPHQPFQSPLQLVPPPSQPNIVLGRDLSSLLMAAQHQVENAHRLSQLVFNVLEANKNLEEWCQARSK